MAEVKSILVKRDGAIPRTCRVLSESRSQVFWAEGTNEWKVKVKAIFLKRVKGCNIRKKSKDLMLNRLKKATIIVLTGHHYVQGSEIGYTDFFGEKRPLSKIFRYNERTKRSRVVSHQARLLICTGCLWLAPRSANFLARAFPQADVLGFAAKSLYFKGAFWQNFIRTIPDVTGLNRSTLESSFCQSQILTKWIQFIEKADSDRTLSKGAFRQTGGWANPTWSSPAYMASGGRVRIWNTRTKKWYEKSWPAVNQVGIGPIHPPGNSISYN